MPITINGKPLYNRKTPHRKLEIVKVAIDNRDNVDEICLKAEVTANTVKCVREGVF